MIRLALRLAALPALTGCAAVQVAPCLVNSAICN
jgi:hypothetical protein